MSVFVVSFHNFFVCYDELIKFLVRVSLDETKKLKKFDHKGGLSFLIKLASISFMFSEQ